MKPLMIQGTSSSSGKTVLTAGLLRYFSLKGYDCAPFKSQNMSLNSIVTEEGYEIALSQAIQCEAAFKKPTPLINPILLKPSPDEKIHLILNGRYYGNMNFKAYNMRKNFFLRKAKESFEELSGKNDLIILEGAGSPAEINLFKFDIVNMGFAEQYDIRVILVADIERGGAFASLFGTVRLLPLKWRRLIKGFIINKFRGDFSILSSGIKSIESRLGIPCIGILPFIKDLRIEAEDSLNFVSPGEGNEEKAPRSGVKIGIVKLEHIANFNEFDPLFLDGRFEVRFFGGFPENINEFDMIIIPGTKSTVPDLSSLKKSGLFDYINLFSKKGRGVLMGICGGFQMMGAEVRDPFRLESAEGVTPGFGFFDNFTVMEKEKRLANRGYDFDFMGFKGVIKGYEIHNGKTFSASGELLNQDFILSEDNKKIGTYMHGLFENELFRDFISGMLKGHSGYKNMRGYSEFKEKNYNLLSSKVGKHLNCALIEELFL